MVLLVSFTDDFICFQRWNFFIIGLQDEKAQIETTNQSLVQENQMVLQQIDDLRDKFENLRKEHEELEVKSKAELKVLVKEVKTLRTTQSELKQELSRTMKEKLEMEVKCSLCTRFMQVCCVVEQLENPAVLTLKF